MDNVIFVQKCVLFDRDTKKILILKRSDYKDWGAGKWDFPGGRMEEEEDCRVGIKRELEEELGVRLISFRPFEVYSSLSYDKKRNVIFVMSYGDNYKIIGKEMVLDHEHTEMKWIEPIELDKYELIESIDHIKKEIMEFTSKL